MNILITGATGFIGSHILEKLGGNHHFFLLLRSEVPDTHAHFNNFVFKDDIEALTNYISVNRIDGVLHLATLYIAQHKASDIRELVLSNIYLGAAIMQACVDAKVKWFINTGTFWQHSDSNIRDYSPVNLYSATKQAFIDLALFYSKVSDMRIVTLKICDSYGPGDTRSKIFNLFEKISRSGEILEMSPGEQLIDILYVDDIVSAFSLLIDRIGKENELENEYVISSNQRYNLKELASIFQQVSGRKLNISWGGKPYRDREVMEPWKMGRLLPGWQQNFDIYRGLSEFLKHD